MRNTRFAALALLAVAGCTPSAASNDDPKAQPPAPARFDRPAMVRFHMARHFDDLRLIEQKLLAGHLADAKTVAVLLTKPAPDPGMSPWATDINAVGDAARALGESPSVDEALRREVRVAQACAWCHLRLQAQPVVAPPPAVIADDGTPVARMARHRWATDRLWEGLVGPSSSSWRAGLDVLAATPLSFAPVTDAPALGAQLQQLAGTARTKLRDGSETLDDRSRLYGEMLVTCAACHTSLAVSPH